MQFLGRNQQKPKTMLGGCKDKQRKGVSKVKPISTGKILLGLAHGVNSVKLVGVVNIGSFCFEVALNALLGNSTNLRFGASKSVYDIPFQQPGHTRVLPEE